MKRRTGHLVAVTLVAAALCADRAVAATPALRPQATSTAGKLVTRLSVSFRRVVPTVRVYEMRREVAACERAILAAIQVEPTNVAPRYRLGWYAAFEAKPEWGLTKSIGIAPRRVAELIALATTHAA